VLRASLAEGQAALASQAQQASAHAAALEDSAARLQEQIAALRKEGLGKDARLGELETALDLRAQNQAQLGEELLRAQAQIDLIKELLLREAGL
jgi:peptidyl-tRNA hydrolase